MPALSVWPIYIFYGMDGLLLLWLFIVLFVSAQERPASAGRSDAVREGERPPEDAVPA